MRRERGHRSCATCRLCRVSVKDERQRERDARLTLGYCRDQLEGEILYSIVELQRYLRVAYEPGPSAVVLWPCARAARRVAALTLVSRFNGRRTVCTPRRSLALRSPTSKSRWLPVSASLVETQRRRRVIRSGNLRQCQLCPCRFSPALACPPPFRSFLTDVSIAEIVLSFVPIRTAPKSSSNKETALTLTRTIRADDSIAISVDFS